ncbi:MAG: hypothetical protein AABZ30_13895 [Myxococcota bacterium]
MLTTAITGGFVALLTWMGVEPGPYIPVLWVAVKIAVVGSVAGLVWWRRRRARGPIASPPSPR